MRMAAGHHVTGSLLAALASAVGSSAPRSLTVLVVLAAAPLYLFHGLRIAWHARRTIVLNLVLFLLLGTLWFGPRGLWRAAARTVRIAGRVYRAAHVLFMEDDVYDDGYTG